MKIHFFKNDRGAIAPITAILVAALIGVAGFTIDLGHLMFVQRKLQQSANAAALAGAADVATSSSSAVTKANSYSAQPGGKNVVPGLTVTTTTVPKCLTSVTYPTCTAGTYNAIQVTQRTTFPTWFARVLGVSTLSAAAQATASAKGGSALALDVMIVLDSTASMNSNDNKCSGGRTRIACAKYGVIQILNALNPQKDRVGIMVYPGFSSVTTAKSQSKCPPTTPRGSDLADYAAYKPGSAPFYSVIYDSSGAASVSNSYKTTGTSSSLVATSDLVIAAGGGSCGTNSGIQAVGGKGTYYAQAITAAQAALASSGSNTSQKVIVLLSDGDAQSSNISASLKSNQCQQAIAAAASATAQGTWVYSIAYGAASTGGSGSCSTDTTNYSGVNKKNLSACQAMAAIASSSDKFYSDGAQGCSAGPGHTDSNLNNLFGNIVMSLTKPRLIPNNSM